MFFRRKACEVCQSKDATIRQLEEKLSSALAEIRSLKVSPDASSDRSIETETVYYDKSLDWHRMELQEIEREIQNIYSKFGRTKGSISAVNELQRIQQEIKKRNAASSDKNVTKRVAEVKSDPKTNVRQKRNPFNKQTADYAIREICEKYSIQFKDIILHSSSDWLGNSIVATDRQNLISFIEEHASKVSKKAGFSGDPKDFGKLLSNDERAWNRLVQSQIPAVLKEEEKARRAEDLRNKHWGALQPVLRDALMAHKPQLISNLRKSYVVNEYGTIEKDVRDAEIERFLKSVKLFAKANGVGLSKVLGYVKAWATREINSTTIKTPLPENGLDFEYWVADRLNERNWQAQVTQGSGDQGVDVVAKVDSLRLAIQCKLYTGSVGNKAVQEVLAGMSFFDLDRGVIISTGKYTKSAVALANKNQILLLTPEDIPYLSEFLQK